MTFSNSGSANWKRRKQITIPVKRPLWTVNYGGDAVPASAVPAWTTTSSGTFTNSVSAGILTLSHATTASDYVYHNLTTFALSNTVGSTIESRLKVTAGTTIVGTVSYHAISCRDGTRAPMLGFHTDGVVLYQESSTTTQLAIIPMDTTDDYHTYRLTLKGNTVRVYVDGQERLALDISGTTSNNFFNFGSGNNAGATSTVTIDYVFCSNQGAFGPGQEAAAMPPFRAPVIIHGQEVAGGCQPDFDDVRIMCGENQLDQFYADLAQGDADLVFGFNTVAMKASTGFTANMTGMIGKASLYLKNAQSWTVAYNATVLPASASPAWTKKTTGTANEVIIGGDTLIRSDTGGSGNYLQYCRDTIGLSNTTGTTVEARVKIITSSVIGNTTGSGIAISDGTRRGNVHIHSDGIEVFDSDGTTQRGTYSMTTTDAFHTYRVTLVGTTMKVYVDGTLRVTATLSGSSATNRIIFGTMNNHLTSEDHWKFVWYSSAGAYAPAGDITVEVQADSSGVPSGTALATGTIPLFSETSYAWKDVTFNTPTKLTGGTKYHLVAYTGDSADASYYSWKGDLTNQKYGPGGTSMKLTNSAYQQGGYLFADGFTRADSATVGNGWIEGSESGGTYAITSNALVFTGNSSLAQSYCYKEFTADDGKGTTIVKVRSKISTAAPPDSASVIVNLATAWNGFTTGAVYWGSDGHFKYYTGAAWANLSTDTTYSANTYYEVEVRVDNVAQTYDIYIDGVAKHTGQAWTGGASAAGYDTLIAHYRESTNSYDGITVTVDEVGLTKTGSALFKTYMSFAEVSYSPVELFDQVNSDLTTAGLANITADAEWRGQSFIAGHTAYLDSFQFYLSTSASATVTAIVTALDGSGLPTGAALASEAGIVINQSTAAWTTFTFTTPAKLTAGVKYGVYLKRTAGTGSVAFTGKNANIYSGGGILVSDNSGSTWSSTTTSDLSFRSVFLGAKFDAAFEEPQGEYYVYYDNASATAPSYTMVAGATPQGIAGDPVYQVPAWNTVYHGDVLPANSSPAWTVGQNDGTVTEDLTTAPGAFRQSAASGSNRRTYYINNPSMSDTTGTTLEIRVRNISGGIAQGTGSGGSANGVQYFAPAIAGSAKACYLQIASDSIRLHGNNSTDIGVRIPMTTGIYRTYRLTLKGTTATAYVDGRLIATSTTNEVSTDKRVIFGIWYDGSGSGGHEEYIDYVAYSIYGAFSPQELPLPLYGSEEVLTTVNGNVNKSGSNQQNAAVLIFRDGKPIRYENTDASGNYTTEVPDGGVVSGFAYKTGDSSLKPVGHVSA